MARHRSFGRLSAVTHSALSVGFIDLDIRYGGPKFTSRTIFDERSCRWASPQDLQRHRIAKAADPMRVQRFLVRRRRGAGARAVSAHRIGRTPGRYANRLDRAFMAPDAAVQGLGVTFGSTSSTVAHLCEGPLRPVFETGEDLPVQTDSAFIRTGEPGVRRSRVS